MGDAREALAVALRALVGIPCKRSLATNSIKFRFDCRLSDKGRAYLWIDPPWRLTLAGDLVSGSADWPVWDGVEDKEVNQPLWEAWCARFDLLDRATLSDVTVDRGCPDIRLRFESGHIIETFGNSTHGYWWYYRDRLTGEVFEAGSAGISHEFAEPADTLP